MALATLDEHQPRSFRAPRVLHHGQWSGLEVLVISALTTSGNHPAADAVRIEAAREVTMIGGRTTTPLGDSEFFARLLRRTFPLAESPQGERLLAAVEVLGERHGGDVLDTGGWHGDWGQWNMGVSRDVLQVWDWERFEPHVPLGFDELHYAAQSVRPEGPEASAQEAAFLASVDARLAELDVPRGQRHLTPRLYLAEMAARYLEALGHGATPVLQLRTAWVLSLLEQQLHHPRSGPKGTP
jgi:hypothetical protein